MVVELYDEDNIIHDYLIYDFNGKFLLSLENGRADVEYIKIDNFDLRSIKISFINDQIIFYEITDNNVTGKYIYYLDGTKELIENNSK